MTTTQKLFALAGLGISVPAMALAAVTAGDTMPTTEAEIRAALEEQGYTVQEFEVEDGEIEVEYLADGQLYEMSIASATGIVTEIELEDDVNEDEDDD